MGNFRNRLAAMNESKTRPIPPSVVKAIGVPVVRMACPAIYLQGPDFWKRAAGITGKPLYPPSHFEPQNYPRITQPEQGEQ